jgi:hypothetical protein
MKSAKVIVLMLAVTFLFTQVAFAGITAMDVELDTDFSSSTEEKSTATGSDTDLTNFAQGGRIEVNFGGKTENEDGMFVAGYADIDLNDDGSIDTDDMYVQIGAPAWSVKVGRFEGEGLMSLGEDVYIAEAPGGPDRYEGNYSRGRDYVGLALNFNAGDALMIEVDMMYDESGDNNVLGGRPLVMFSTEAFTLKAGADYYMESPKNNDAKGETTKMGFSADASFAMGNMTIGAAGAMGTVGGKDVDAATGNEVDKDDEKTLTVWGYLTMGVGEGTLGVGGGMTMLEYDKADTEKSHLQAFVSYAQPLPVEGATVKLAGSYAGAELEKQTGLEDQSNSAFGVRLRLCYDIPL